MRKLLWGSFLLAGIALAANAQNTAVKGATATVTNFNPAKGTATVEVFNKSDKDITAYSLAIETVFKEHQIDRSERMGDYGAAMTARGEALHPGQTGTEALQISSPKPGNSVTSIKATLVAVVFADQTAEASDSEALDRIVEHRTSEAEMTQMSVDAVSQALAGTSQDLGATAAKIIRDRLQTPRPVNSKGPGISEEYMKYKAAEFEKTPQSAASRHVTEREYLTQRLGELEEQAQQQETFAQIRRQPG